MIAYLVSLFLAAVSPAPLNNVHAIYCTKDGMDYQGTGFFVEDGVMVTALHERRSHW